MLFSATQTTKVTDLARISLRPGPVHIDVDKEETTSTVATLSQGYIVCPSERRFLLLFTFLKKNLKKKVIVFFSSCNSVKYHSELLNYIDVPVLDLHVSIFLASENSDSDILCRASKNNKSAQIRSSNLLMRNLGSSYVPTSPRGASISPAWTTSCSTIPQTTRATTSTALGAQHAQERLERACCSCSRASSGSCGTSKRPRCR